MKTEMKDTKKKEGKIIEEGRNFKKIGIYGWQKIEPCILAAISAGESVLLIGRHGTNKTEGAEAIAKHILGKESSFVKYDVPLVQVEDLLGYPNPSSLSSGKIEYVKTPTSIWTPDAVLLDEINRANMFTQAKLMELVRNKTVMGTKTNVKIVFGAVNPPEEYNSGYMDLAVASRFVCIKVSDSDLSQEDAMRIVLEGNSSGQDSVNLGKIVEEARNHVFSEKCQKSIARFVLEVRNTLESLHVVWSMRQAYGLGLMLKSLIAFDVTGAYHIGASDIQRCVLSTIPQIHGIVSTSIDNETQVENQIRSICAKFSDLSEFHDTDVVTLASGDASDGILWISSVTRALESEESIETIDKVRGIIEQRFKDGEIDAEQNASISSACSRRAVSLGIVGCKGELTVKSVSKALEAALGHGGVIGNEPYCPDEKEVESFEREASKAVPKTYLDRVLMKLDVLEESDGNIFDF